MKESRQIINRLNLDIAEDISKNSKSATSFLNENDVDINFYLNKAKKEFKKKNSKNSNDQLTKSQTFFRRVVLGAEIAYQCYNENTFGSVKFQKLIYLCEQVSRMKFTTSYTKQAAGPFDNKLMHGIKKEFLKQKWFKLEKSSGKFNRVNFIPLENLNSYKQYYNRYYHSVDEDIQYVISIFKKSYTNEVELVATIFACWVKIINDKMIFSEELIIDMVYNWSKEKKKFSRSQIIKSISWMNEHGLVPID